MAVVTGIALGLQEVLQPPRRAEIEVVDPWEAGPGPQARVRFHWHPSPPASVAEVRW